MLLIFGGAVLVLLFVALVATLLVKRLTDKARVAICTTIYTLLFTPSFAPATIVVVPMPFGVMLGAGVFGGAPNEIAELLYLFWWWHLPAFIITGLISYKIAIKIVGYSNVHHRNT
ncbi:hypothetical protein [Grimontia sp. NTOU-MAR1]|uniref:hypothetical protein n=1 Tax=Grimontia sp. NTOU-MAR1 TaxID=3111011 RepID=UPI002DB7D49F|nr:hypothetical protein [Grimontia sp. NTOU-MAR1]WRV97956.1 hypothetical protein VP504_00510 [Grimontia sp. NTOU-MAR1]